MPSMMIVTIHDEPHVSLPDAAVLKRVSRQGIWEACRQKRLPSIRRGRFLYVPLAEVRRWRPHRRTKPPPRAAA